MKYKFNIGDRVKIIEVVTQDYGTGLSIGDEGTVVNIVDSNYSVKFDKNITSSYNVNLNDDGSYYMFPYQLKLIDDVEIKLGDMVEIINSTNKYRHDFEVGEIVTISHIWGGEYVGVNKHGDMQLLSSNQVKKLSPTKYLIHAVHFGNSKIYTWICSEELYNNIDLNSLVEVDSNGENQIVQVVEKSETLEYGTAYRNVIAVLDIVYKIKK